LIQLQYQAKFPEDRDGLIRPFESTKTRLQLCPTRLFFKELSFPAEVSARFFSSCMWPQPCTPSRYKRCNSVISKVKEEGQKNSAQAKKKKKK